MSCTKKAQAALAKVEGVEGTPKVEMPDVAEVKGTAKPEDLIAALKGVGFQGSVR